MNRIYIAGPMTGYADYNFPAFHAAARAWREMGWEVLNPAEAFDGDTTRPYRDYVVHDIDLLNTCDAIAVLPGWDGEGARGSVWEWGVAIMLLGIPSYNAERPVSPPSGGKGESGHYDPQISNPKDAIGSNKIPMHLWPETATALGALGLLDGALKYGRANFREIGVRASIYYDALKRHVNLWFEGEDTDPDSGLPHLAHALACIAILVDAKAAGKLTDDRQVRGGLRSLMTELTPHVARLKELHKDKHPKHYTIADNPQED